MMFDNGEAQREELVVEFNGGTNDGRSKKGHLAKVKYLDFLEEILDSSKWIDVCMFGQIWENACMFRLVDYVGHQHFSIVHWSL